MRKLLLKICWALEDTADLLFAPYSHKFYPSRFFEKVKPIHPVGETPEPIKRRGKTRQVGDHRPWLRHT